MVAVLAATVGVTTAGPASAAPARPWINAALSPEVFTSADGVTFGTAVAAGTGSSTFRWSIADLTAFS